MCTHQRAYSRQLRCSLLEDWLKIQTQLDKRITLNTTNMSFLFGERRGGTLNTWYCNWKDYVLYDFNYVSFWEEEGRMSKMSQRTVRAMKVSCMTSAWWTHIIPAQRNSIQHRLLVLGDDDASKRCLRYTKSHWGRILIVGKATGLTERPMGILCAEICDDPVTIFKNCLLQ